MSGFCHIVILLVVLCLTSWNLGSFMAPPFFILLPSQAPFLLLTRSLHDKESYRIQLVWTRCGRMRVWLGDTARRTQALMQSSNSDRDWMVIPVSSCVSPIKVNWQRVWLRFNSSQSSGLVLRACEIDLYLIFSGLLFIFLYIYFLYLFYYPVSPLATSFQFFLLIKVVGCIEGVMRRATLHIVSDARTHTAGERAWTKLTL